MYTIMSKLICIRNDLYKQLTDIKGKKHSYSDVIDILFNKCGIDNKKSLQLIYVKEPKSLDACDKPNDTAADKTSEMSVAGSKLSIDVKNSLKYVCEDINKLQSLNDPAGAISQKIPLVPSSVNHSPIIQPPADDNYKMSDASKKENNTMAGTPDKPHEAT